jgi:hypothetical protein
MLGAEPVRFRESRHHDDKQKKNSTHKIVTFRPPRPFAEQKQAEHHESAYLEKKID